MSGLGWLAWVFAGFVGVTIFARVVPEVWRRGTAGAVFLDLGAREGRGLDLAIGALAMTAWTMCGFAMHSAAFAFPAALCVCFALVRATDRMQLREAGIMADRRGFVPWRKIGAYELTPAGRLSVKVGKRWQFCGEVPAARQPEVEQILATHLAPAAERPPQVSGS